MATTCELSSKSDCAARSQVVPQNSTMFSDTFKNNIRYGRRDATDEELDEVAEAAQLTIFIESLLDG